MDGRGKSPSPQATRHSRPSSSLRTGYRDADRLNDVLAILTAGAYLFLPLALTAAFLAVADFSSRLYPFVFLFLLFVVLALFIVKKSALVFELFSDLKTMRYADLWHKWWKRVEDRLRYAPGK